MPGIRPKTGENRICEICGNQYYVSGWRLKRGNSRFCGSECQNHKQYERFKFNCVQCNKECEDSPCRSNKKRFCSKECVVIFQTHKKVCQKEIRRIAMIKVREKGLAGQSGPSIRKFAFAKKECICQVCGYDEYKCCLDVHHVDGNPNNNIIENLAILCCICHRKVHRKIINIDEKEINDKRRKFPRKSDKLTKKDVIEIKEMLKESNLTHKEIAEKYSVEREYISKINVGSRWSHITI